MRLSDSEINFRSCIIAIVIGAGLTCAGLLIFGHDKQRHNQVTYSEMARPSIMGLEDCKAFRMESGHSKVYILRCPQSQVGVTQETKNGKTTEYSYSSTSE